MGNKRNKWPGVRTVSASSIEISFMYQGERCREPIKLKPTPANLRKAHFHRGAILDAIGRGTFDYATTFPKSKRAKKELSTTSLRYYLDQWLKRIQPTLKASTYTTHRRIVENQLIPAFGHLPLSAMRWKDVKDWAYAREVGPKTIKNIVSVLRSALNDAVDDDLIEHNPLVGKSIRTRSTVVKKDEIDPFTQEERRVILAAASRQNRNLVQFGFWTGMRISELCALNWGDVDWQRGTVRVNKALTQAAASSEEPKTYASIRDVKLLPPAMEALKVQKEHTYLKGEEIFQNERQVRWSGDQSIRTMWKVLLRRAKVRYRYPYQMRHTWASMMLMAGEPVMWVSQQLGHTSWAFTAKTYSRFIQDDAPDAGTKAVEKWAKNPVKNPVKVSQK